MSEKKKTSMTERDVMILERTVKATNNLYSNLNLLDFEISKFNKFEQKLSSFKITNTIVISSVALITGAYLGAFIGEKYTNYYIQNQTKKEIGESIHTINLLQKYKIEVSDNTDSIQIYVKKSAKNTVFQNDKYSVLNIEK